MVNLFERLNKRPPAAEPREKLPRDDLEHAQRLLDFLQRCQKPTITEREIRIYGPQSIRDRKSAIRSAEILVHFGWLTPIRSAYYNGRMWQITRKPIVGPSVAADWQLHHDLAGKM
jgi:hypothetical protein